VISWLPGVMMNSFNRVAVGTAGIAIAAGIGLCAAGTGCAVANAEPLGPGTSWAQGPWYPGPGGPWGGGGGWGGPPPPPPPSYAGYGGGYGGYGGYGGGQCISGPLGFIRLCI
jgi:hypothetical protein